MFQRDSRWWKINDTKSLADTGLYFFKRKLCKFIFIKEKQYKTYRFPLAFEKIRASAFLAKIQKDQDVITAIVYILEPLPKLPSLNLTLVSQPHPFKLLLGSSMGWGRPVSAESPFIVHYSPAPRNPTAKQDYLQTKADGGQHGGTMGNRKVFLHEIFHDHLH